VDDDLRGDRGVNDHCEEGNLSVGKYLKTGGDGVHFQGARHAELGSIIPEEKSH